jgi:hypothetical protein
VAREGAMRLGGTMRLREDPPPDPTTSKQGKVRWSVEPAQITDLVTPFACADYPAGGAPSIKSLRSDGVVSTPTVLKANEWLRAGAAELESGAPKVAHPGGITSSNAAEATKAFLARKCTSSTLASTANAIQRKGPN